VGHTEMYYYNNQKFVFLMIELYMRHHDLDHMPYY